VSAARAILEILPALAEALDDAVLRRRMAQAALFAGLAFSTTKTALAHALSYPITLRHGVPHGIAAAFTLPRVMTAALGIDPACDAALGEIFGADLTAAAARFEAFLEGLGVATSCTAYGIGDDEFDAMIVDKVRASFAAGTEG
jgi:alcohol dehydrogenase